MMIRNTVLALAAALSLAGAQAASFTFTGQLDDGVLAGQTFSGQFSYDETKLVGSAYELLDLSSWTLNALGQSFSSAGASVVPQAAFFDGQFVGISATHEVGGYGVNLVDGGTDLRDAYLAYRTPAGEGFGSYTVSSAVPEPSSWLMGLAGAAALGFVVRRRARA